MANNKPTLYTCLSPALLHLYDLRNAVVVIIDVFRATSTIASALHNGAQCIIPVDEVAKAIALSINIKGSIAAGERDGQIAEGLQHGNSPLEYNRDFIENRTLVLTTTNGTRLLQMALDNEADTIITGSFPNLSAVCDFLIKQNKNVVLGCAGWKDRYNLEDTLFAGAVISRIKENFTIHCDSSFMANQLYHQHKDNLTQYIKTTTHWHRLAAYGLEADMLYCISKDTAPSLPIYKDGALVNAL